MDAGRSERAYEAIAEVPRGEWRSRRWVVEVEELPDGRLVFAASWPGHQWSLPMLCRLAEAVAAQIADIESGRLLPPEPGSGAHG